jgi:hypothetical protein
VCRRRRPSLSSVVVVRPSVPIEFPCKFISFTSQHFNVGNLHTMGSSLFSSHVSTYEAKYGTDLRGNFIQFPVRLLGSRYRK